MQNNKNSNILPTASQYINDTSREYSLHVCESRAIPAVTDGLKDSQRKGLWLMHNKTDKIKTVSLAGEMISSGLYLAGDASASAAVAMLAAPYVNNVPLLHGVGGFGTRVAPVDGIASPRYNYLKKTSTTDKLVYPDLPLIPMIDNYDGSTKMPSHFLPIIPLVLLNGVSGIAVGWSTSILPRNLKKLIAATQQVLNGKEPRGLEPAYDYLNVDIVNLEPNVWQISGRCEVMDTSTIKITELPPGLNLENMKKRLNKFEEEGKIQTYTDRSTAQISITVKFKRGEVTGWDNEQAVTFFKLREKANERIVVIDWNGSGIRQYESPQEVVKEFVAWRLNWYTARYQKMLTDDTYELKYWQGIKACFDDKLPERLGRKSNKGEIVDEVQNITVLVGLDSVQLEKIVNLPIHRWAQDSYLQILDNIQRLNGTISQHTAVLKSPQAILDIYMGELDELKKLK